MSIDQNKPKGNPVFALPTAFKEYENLPVWLCSINKKPISPLTGNSFGFNKPENWGTYAQVYEFIKKHPDKDIYPAIVVSEMTGDLICLDLDHVLDSNGHTSDWAQEVLMHYDTYTELSPGGDGFHIFARGQRPGTRTVKNFPNGQNLEIFDSQSSPKPIRLSGNIVDGKGVIVEKQSAINNLYNQYFQVSESTSSIKSVESPKMTDEEVLDKLLNAKNADKFKLLFEKGDLSGYEGNHSSADLALINLICFYTQNPIQITRIFHTSKLGKREKAYRSDYLERTIEQALSRASDSVYTETAKKEGARADLCVYGIGQLLQATLPSRPLILEPWCRQQGIIMVHAWRGVGKTFFALNVGYAIASGGTFLNWNCPTPRRVLLIDGEMPLIGLQERFAGVVASHTSEIPDDTYFQLIAADAQENALPSLDSEAGKSLVEPFIDQAEVIIIDNLSTLTRAVENDADAWLPMQQWLLNLRRRGKTVIIIHHSGKGGAQRGTSKREDILDVVIHLKQPKDYVAEQGARFEVHFEKARGVHGEAVRSLEVSAQSNENSITWSSRELESNRFEMIKEFMELGMKDHEIYQELDISRATYYRDKKKMAQQGLQ